MKGAEHRPFDVVGEARQDLGVVVVAEAVEVSTVFLFWDIDSPSVSIGL
jgi:hypothetical protein